MNMNIDEKDFEFYSGFCHFIRCKENNPIKWCTHFEGPAECNMEKCPLIKQRLRERGEE
jgi:hypothetical protein